MSIYHTPEEVVDHIKLNAFGYSERETYTADQIDAMFVQVIEVIRDEITELLESLRIRRG